MLCAVREGRMTGAEADRGADRESSLGTAAFWVSTFPGPRVAGPSTVLSYSTCRWCAGLCIEPPVRAPSPSQSGFVQHSCLPPHLSRQPCSCAASPADSIRWLLGSLHPAPAVSWRALGSARAPGGCCWEPSGRYVRSPLAPATQPQATHHPVSCTSRIHPRPPSRHCGCRSSVRTPACGWIVGWPRDCHRAHHLWHKDCYRSSVAREPFAAYLPLLSSLPAVLVPASLVVCIRTIAFQWATSSRCPPDCCRLLLLLSPLPPLTRTEQPCRRQPPSLAAVSTPANERSWSDQSSTSTTSFASSTNRLACPCTQAARIRGAIWQACCGRWTSTSQRHRRQQHRSLPRITCVWCTDWIGTPADASCWRVDDMSPS